MTYRVLAWKNKNLKKKVAFLHSLNSDLKKKSGLKSAQVATLKCKGESSSPGYLLLTLNSQKVKYYSECAT